MKSKAIRNTTHNFAVYAVVAIASSSFYAQAQDKSDSTAGNAATVVVGLRTWINDWQGNSIAQTAGGKNVITHANSETKALIVPFALIRYGNFGASASTVLKKNYQLTDGNTIISNDRKEFDVNALYYFAPSASVSLGYKNIEWQGLEIKGVTVGVSGSAAITEKVGIYGTLGIGKLNTNVFGVGTAPTDYALIESGLSYSFGALGSSIKSSAATLGYRYQKIRANGLNIGNSIKSNLTDNTSGITLGVVFGF